METAMKVLTIKFVVYDSMKAKLKATAALHNKTMGDFFMDAVLEKYPYLKEDKHNEQNLKDKIKSLDGEGYAEEK